MNSHSVTSKHCTTCLTPLSGPYWTPQRPGAWHQICTLRLDGVQVEQGATLRFRRDVIQRIGRVQRLCATCYTDYCSLQ